MTLKNIIERGLELGLEAVEVYAVTSESNRISLHQGELDKYTLSEIFSISIRGLKDGKMGYSTLEEVVGENKVIGAASGNTKESNIRTIKMDDDLIKTARQVGICLGD